MNRTCYSLVVAFLVVGLLGCQADGPRRGTKYQSYWDRPGAQVTKIRDFFASSLNLEWAQSHVNDQRLAQAELASANHNPAEAQRLISTLNTAQLNQYSLVRLHLISAELALRQGQTSRAALEVSKIPSHILLPEQQVRYQRLLAALRPGTRQMQVRSFMPLSIRQQAMAGGRVSNRTAAGVPRRSNVSRLVLVLPLSGKEANQALALRDGFLTGYWQTKSPANRGLIIQVADRQTTSPVQLQQLARQPGTLVIAPHISAKVTPAQAFEQGKLTFVSVNQV